MKPFFVLCLTFSPSIPFILSGSPSYSQETDQPIVTYSEPKTVMGDPTRCKMTSLAIGHQIIINFQDTTASSQGAKKDSLKCRVEADASIQIQKGWYFHSIEHSLEGAVLKSPKSKAVLAVQSTFQKKVVLKIRETKSSSLISKSNRLLLESNWSKAKQCSCEISNITGKFSLNLDAQTQGDAQSKLDAFGVVLIFSKCDL